MRVIKLLPARDGTQPPTELEVSDFSRTPAIRSDDRILLDEFDDSASWNTLRSEMRFE